MDKITNIISEINGKINSVVWGIPMLVLILSTGIYLTIRTGFFHVVGDKKPIFLCYDGK